MKAALFEAVLFTILFKAILFKVVLFERGEQLFASKGAKVKNPFGVEDEGIIISFADLSTKV